MENENQKRSSVWSKVLIAFLFFIIGGAATYFGTKVIEKYNKTHEITTTDVVSTPVEYVSTFDVVNQRRAEMQQMKTDSIYYSIPETAFIEIIDLLGTNITHETVVNQYDKRKQYYIGIDRGAKNERLKQDTLAAKPAIIKDTPVIPEEKLY